MKGSDEMAEVKWVKITTDMFDNRKIKHLRKLPEGNNIVLIWVMLLTMAGRCNAGGMIFLTENIPYTPKMLADELGFEENTVILALQMLEQFNMISTDNGCFFIAGWNEYQNIEGMEKIREQNRRRVAAHRQRQKALAESNVSSNVTVTQRNAADIDIDLEREEEKEGYMGDSVPESPPPLQKPVKPVKHKYGEYKRVMLTDDELAKLQENYPDWQERIQRLDDYIEQSGRRYKSHYATIRNWAKKDQQAQPIPRQQAQTYKKQSKAEEMNDFYNMAANWAAESE